MKYSLGLDLVSDAIESAVKGVLAKGYRTGDISYGTTNVIGTKKMGKFIKEEIIKGN
jgi:3-isopropylmalate dehydrogenase